MNADWKIQAGSEWEERKRLFIIKVGHNMKISKRIPGFLKGDLNPSRTPEARERIRKWRKNYITTELTKRKISRSMKRALKNPELLHKWSQNKMGHKLTEQTKEKIAFTKAKKPKKMSTLMKMADSIYSIYIRRKYSTNGYVRCFTCDKVHLVEEMHCGHFVGRGHHSTRFMEENTHPQCRYCNVFCEGQKDVYAIRLMEKYGQDILQKLNIEKNKIKKFTPEELKEIYEKYKKKVEELL